MAAVAMKRDEAIQDLGAQALKDDAARLVLADHLRDEGRDAEADALNVEIAPGVAPDRWGNEEERAAHKATRVAANVAFGLPSEDVEDAQKAVLQLRQTIIKPGVMVGLRSSVSGGVHYDRIDLDVGDAADPNVHRTRWQTTKTVADPDEHERAEKARSRARAEIAKVCSASTWFGLLCPEDREAELDAAIERAKEIADAHNKTATFTRVSLCVLKGRIASSDRQANQSIAREISTLVDQMRDGIDRLDPKAVRDAADGARDLLAMLDSSQEETLSQAVAQARKAARDIVRRIEKQGEQASVVLADIQKGAIERARQAFSQ